MTSPLATVGVTYDGVDLQDLPAGIFLQIVVGLAEPPSVRGEDTTIPAAAGTLEGNRINDTLAIELRGIVCAASSAVTQQDQRESFRANQRILRDLFATNRPRADLVATLEDGTVQAISARPLQGVIWAETVRSELAEVSYPLEGNDDWAIVP